MINILGLGSSKGKTELNKDLLTEIFQVKGNPCNLPEKVCLYSTLPLDSLNTSNPFNFRENAKKALQTPTDLSLEAITIALDQAGIKAEDIGMIIGSCPTPWQLTPGEAQRVGEKLGLKVPAYDISASTSDMLLFYLGLFSQYNSNSLPQYILGIVSNTPTRHIDYSNGIEGLYFSDGASAIVFSKNKEGIYKLVNFKSKRESQFYHSLVVDSYGAIKLSSNYFNNKEDLKKFFIQCYGKEANTEDILTDINFTLNNAHSEGLFLGHSLFYYLANSNTIRQESKEKENITLYTSGLGTLSQVAEIVLER